MRLLPAAALLAAALGCSGPSRAEREAESRALEGDAFLQKGDALGALRIYEAVLADLPGFPRAALQRGICWERLGRVDQAVAAYDEFLAAAPDRPEAAAARARRDRLNALKAWDPAKGPKAKETLD